MDEFLDLPRVGGFLASVAREALLEHVCEQRNADEILAKIVVQILSDAPLFALADFENLSLEHLALCHVAIHADETNDISALIPQREFRRDQRTEFAVWIEGLFDSLDDRFSCDHLAFIREVSVCEFRREKISVGFADCLFLRFHAQKPQMRSIVQNHPALVVLYENRV